MSKYTTELRFICESFSGRSQSAGYYSTKTIIEQALPHIFQFDYPIFDESYRKLLEAKIVRHFYTREICEETFGLWELRLEDKMNLIMPYYNQLYRSAALEFNPFYDVEVTRKHQGTNVRNEDRSENNTSERQSTITNTGDKVNVDVKVRNENIDENNTTELHSTKSGNSDRVTVDAGSTKTNETSTNDDWDLYSDTPQGGIEGITGDTVSGLKFLTNARNTTGNKENNSTEENKSTSAVKDNAVNNENADTSGTKNTDTLERNNATSVSKNSDVNTENSSVNNSNNGTANITGIDEYIETVKGKQGSENYSDMLLKFRKTFLNIDAMILDELNTLFMGVW